jgi:hypothetical protein
MDSTNNFSQSTFQSSDTSFPSFSSSSDSGFFESIKNINATTWLLIIVILAFLGFNIFTYLAQGTQTISNIFGPLTQKIFGTSVAVAGQAVDVSAEGAKAVVGGTADVLTSGLSAVQSTIPAENQAPTINKGQPIGPQQVDMMQQTSLNRALNSSQPQDQDYEAHEASSSIGGLAGKSGWCYIGEDRGFRTCSQVGANDQCMSGDIFPSQEICMNPNLRA